MPDFKMERGSRPEVHTNPLARPEKAQETPEALLAFNVQEVTEKLLAGTASDAEITALEQALAKARELREAEKSLILPRMEPEEMERLRSKFAHDQLFRSFKMQDALRGTTESGNNTDDPFLWIMYLIDNGFMDRAGTLLRDTSPILSRADADVLRRILQRHTLPPQSRAILPGDPFESLPVPFDIPND